MLKIKLFEWVIKTFGHLEARESITFTENKGIKTAPQGDRKYLITEINLNVQLRGYKKKFLNKTNYKKWREELDELTENSVRQFQCENANIYTESKDKSVDPKLASLEPRQFVTGESFLLSLIIFHKIEI